MTSRPNDSPIVKTVYQPKRSLWDVPASDMTSDWSTIGQSSIGKTSEVLGQDWSEDDGDTDSYDPEEESGMESPEKLRKALVQPSQILLPPSLQAVTGYQKIQLTRSPALESLGDLLDIKTRKFRLLHSSASSSSSDEFNLSSPIKVSEVMTSTMVVGGKEREQDMVDISAIKIRESLDPRMSVQPCKAGASEISSDIEGLDRKCGGQEQIGVSAVSNLSVRPVKMLFSTPARSDGSNKWSQVQSGHSLGLSSIHSSEAGGSMLVPRVDRELVTEERVEDTLYMAEAVEPDEQFHQHTISTGSPSLHQSPPTIIIPDTVSGPVPDLPPHVCQFPPPPHAGAVCVTLLDYKTLSKGTFLNDVIIDFYLTYLFREKLSKQDKGKVLIFSSFFFKRLSTDPVEGSMMANTEMDPMLSLAKKRHKRVFNWTKTDKLSSKQMVIFPICKDSHWFLVIAVLTGEKPFLVVMDSLGGDNKEVVDMIKEYLVIELSNQMGGKSLQVGKEMEVVWPCLPQQDNYTDCGLFLLHYVEKLLKRPNEMLCIEDQDLVNWFPKTEVNTKRSSLAKLVRQMAEDQALPGQVTAFPDLFGEEEIDRKEKKVATFEKEEKVATFDKEEKVATFEKEEKVATFEEDELLTDEISDIIKAELSNLSPPTSRRKSVLSSLDTSGEIFSAVVHKTQTTVVVSCPTTARASRPVRKKFRLANTRPAAIQLSIFTQDEYYSGKHSSERRFDQLVEGEGEVKEDMEVFSQ